ncbi:hypothetical protein RUM43_003082 [Polyplax serrata]|uniref:Uncharacterized protein n=1 Tax=Polyplax serrata TaxID=468196 RepID=A0AAN8NVY2_POLSC
MDEECGCSLSRKRLEGKEGETEDGWYQNPFISNILLVAKQKKDDEKVEESKKLITTDVISGPTTSSPGLLPTYPWRELIMMILRTMKRGKTDDREAGHFLSRKNCMNQRARLNDLSD